MGITLAVIAGGMLLIASGGTSLTIADRGMAIPVAEDSTDAVVGIEGDEQILLTYGSTRSNSTSSVSQTPTFFNITNKFSWAVDLSISVIGDSNAPPNLHGDPWINQSQLDPGETASVSGDVVCASQPSERWTFVLTLESEGMRTHVTHNVLISCQQTSSPGQS